MKLVAILFALLACTYEVKSSTKSVNINEDFLCRDSYVVCNCGKKGAKVAAPIKMCADHSFVGGIICRPCANLTELRTVCIIYKNCKTCLYGLTKCLSCPEGRFGHLCNETFFAFPKDIYGSHSEISAYAHVEENDDVNYVDDDYDDYYANNNYVDGNRRNSTRKRIRRAAKNNSTGDTEGDKVEQIYTIPQSKGTHKVAEKDSSEESKDDEVLVIFQSQGTHKFLQTRQRNQKSVVEALFTEDRKRRKRGEIDQVGTMDMNFQRQPTHEVAENNSTDNEYRDNKVEQFYVISQYKGTHRVAGTNSSKESKSGKVEPVHVSPKNKEFYRVTENNPSEESKGDEEEPVRVSPKIQDTFKVPEKNSSEDRKGDKVERFTMIPQSKITYRVAKENSTQESIGNEVDEVGTIGRNFTTQPTTKATKEYPLRGKKARNGVNRNSKLKLIDRDLYRGPGRFWRQRKYGKGRKAHKKPAWNRPVGPYRTDKEEVDEIRARVRIRRGEPISENKELRETNCQFPKLMNTAQLDCTIYHRKIKCNMECVWGHTFIEGTKRQVECRFAEDVWRPFGFSECESVVECALKFVSPGDMYCVSNRVKNPAYCEISCFEYDDTAEAPHNTYECTMEGDWTPPLPFCTEAVKGIGRIGKIDYDDPNSPLKGVVRVQKLGPHDISDPAFHQTDYVPDLHSGWDAKKFLDTNRSVEANKIPLDEYINAKNRQYSLNTGERELE